MRNNIFEKAISQMNKDINSNIFGPIGFNKYLQRNNLPNVKTAENISIDSYEKLYKILKENNIMVLIVGIDD